MLLSDISANSVAAIEEDAVEVDDHSFTSPASPSSWFHPSKAIAAGRCKVLEGSAAELPFEEGVFDLVTAFETVYFWPEIEKCFAGVRRVLKEGGRFVIVNEDDGLSGNNAAGFRDIAVRRDEQLHWLCVTGVK